MPRSGYVYILASAYNGTLYIGVTNDLHRRVWEHRNGAIEGFTKRYGVHRLVYYEAFDDIRNAITREKQLKKWNRAWKLQLISADNPDWTDLHEQLEPSAGSPIRVGDDKTKGLPRIN